VSYWAYNNQLGLQGVEGTLEVLSNCPRGYRAVQVPDPENPLVLNDEVILYALRTSQRARDDFQRLFPTLLPEEQQRYVILLEENPRISALMEDDQRFMDRVQAKDVRSIPVRTSGPRGGKGGRP